MTRLSVVTFKWRATPFSRKKFAAWHVNRLAAMFRRHLRAPHDFVCVTDDPEGLDDQVRAVPLWPDHAEVPNPHGPREPACYRRLKLFSAEAAELVGERVLAIDLDMVLTGDITPLVERPEPVVLLTTTAARIPVNGSLVLVTPGAAGEVWTSFDPETSPRIARSAGCHGSDQGWMAWHLLHGSLRGRAGTWTPGPGADGIMFYGEHLMRGDASRKLPPGTRLVSFHGRGLPWGQCEQLLPWVRSFYGPADGTSVPEAWRDHEREQAGPAD